MAEKLYLDMPMPSKGAPKNTSSFFRILLFLAAVSLAILSIAGGWWLAGGRVNSVSASLDGEVYPVAPEFSARLEKITVKEGDRVKARQPLGHMDTGAYARQLQESVKDAAALRPTLMEKTAGRLRELQEAEKSIVEQLALARNEEEVRRVIREERVMEHVRAQLALRTLDSQGGERAVGKARYQEAKQAEAQARVRLDAAKEDFERYSRMRAVTDVELRRIREEILFPRGNGAGDSAEGEGYSTAGTDGTLYAPVGGTVLRTSVAPGQVVKRGQPVLMILAESGKTEGGFGVVSYFPLAAKDSLGVGQACDVRFEDDPSTLPGEVVELMTPRPLPTKLRSEEARQAVSNGGAWDTDIFVPVRIRVKSPMKGNLLPGKRALCQIRTRSIFGFSGF